MNELMAESGLPADASSGRRRSDSGRLATLLAALRSGRPDVPILRGEFVDFCLQRSKETFESSKGANDEAARRDWLQVRDELVEWFGMECRLDVGAGAKCSPPLGKSAKRLLEKVLDMKLTPSLAGLSAGPRGCITLADLCACDLCVHFMAVLLDSDKFAAVHDFLSYGYVAAGKLRDWRDFYYDAFGKRLMYNAGEGPEKLPGDEAIAELYEHFKNSRLDLNRLVEAEQVILFLRCELAGRQGNLPAGAGLRSAPCPAGRWSSFCAPRKNRDMRT